MGVSPATEKKHTHQRNMPYGIAGRMPTSPVVTRVNPSLPLGDGRGEVSGPGWGFTVDGYS